MLILLPPEPPAFIEATGPVAVAVAAAAATVVVAAAAGNSAGAVGLPEVQTLRLLIQLLTIVPATGDMTALRLWPQLLLVVVKALLFCCAELL
jgi:hypothetical protein